MLFFHSKLHPFRINTDLEEKEDPYSLHQIMSERDAKNQIPQIYPTSPSLTLAETASADPILQIHQ